MPSFTATSLNGVNIVGSFNGGSGGTVAKVCPATNCNDTGAPGFNPGDFLLWAEDANGNGTGPLTLTFPSPTQGAGFYLQLTAPGRFTASFTEIAGANTRTEHLASDNNGSPLFLGALDSIGDVSFAAE